MPNALAGVAQLSTRRGRWLSFRGDDVELVLGERGQVGVLVQVSAQQPVRVLVGTALPGVAARGGAGSQKNTGIDSAVVITACRTISQPRSQVNERRSRVGSRPVWSISAAATASAVFPSGSATTIAYRGGAVDEGGDRRGARSEHQITLPVAGHLPGVGLGRSLVNGDYVPDLTATVRGLLAAGRRIERLLRRQ